MPSIHEWLERVKDEEKKIKEKLRLNNRTMPETKIKFLARFNAGHPPKNEWE